MELAHHYIWNQRAIIQQLVEGLGVIFCAKSTKFGTVTYNVEEN
jgi:hypothetical protein